MVLRLCLCKLVGQRQISFTCRRMGSQPVCMYLTGWEPILLVAVELPNALVA